MTFKVGDRVRVVYSSAVAPGRFGTVIALSSGAVYTVQLDNTSDQNWSYFTDQLVPATALPLDADVDAVVRYLMQA